EWSAGRRGRLDGGDLGDVDPEVGEHAAHAACLGVVAFLDRLERLDLTALDAVERVLESGQHAVEAAARRVRRGPRDRCVWGDARLEPRLAIGRRDEDDLVADR